MEKNRKEPPPFLEMAVLEAKPVYGKGSKGERTVDIKLEKFIPSLAEVPSKELEALKERAMKSGIDFVDFWAIDLNGSRVSHSATTGRTIGPAKTASCSRQRSQVCLPQARNIYGLRKGS